MNRVCYLMSGMAHLPYLVVSLCSLRLRAGWRCSYSDDVRVYAYPNCIDQVRRIAKCKRLFVEACEWEPVAHDEHGPIKASNRQFVNKIKLMRSLPDGFNAYFDADTMPVRPIDKLFEGAERHGFCATQFNGWKTTGRIISKRISRLIDREPIDQRLVHRALTESWPSVNGGVFACSPDSPVLKLWEEWTLAVRDVFIADETVLHTLMLKFAETREFAVLTGGKWNTSPKYQNPNLSDSEVIVWHGHGDSFVRSETKSRKGYDLWWPVWEECVRENIGNCREWMAEAVGQNKFMWKLEQPK